MKYIGRRMVFSMMAAASLGALPVAAQAQVYPAKPILVVVGYPPGSATDFIARLVGPKMAEGLGKALVIENRPGASGVVAAGAVARAAPDGYTIMASVPGPTSAARAVFGAKLQYSPENDLVPIGLVGVAPLVLMTTPNSPIKTAADFMAVSRATSGGLNIGSYGVASPSHFAIEMLRTQSKLPLVHVPHSGPATMQAALLSGVIPVSMDSVTAALPHINSGKMIPLAVTTARRSAMLPDVPTMAEAGLGPVEMVGWVGFHAPKGTPTEIVQKLNAELNRVLALPDIRQQLGTRIELVGGSPAVFAAHLKSETERLNRITADANLTFQ